MDSRWIAGCIMDDQLEKYFDESVTNLLKLIANTITEVTDRQSALESSQLFINSESSKTETSSSQVICLKQLSTEELISTCTHIE